MGKTRFRLQIKFWLDLNKADESELADLIAELKQERTFSRVVRDGIRLAVDLWRGNLDVLLALFPWVEDAFYERFVAQQPEPDISIQEQLAKLERLLIEQGHTPIMSGFMPVSHPRLVSDPDHSNDDPALVITQAASTGQSAQNFLDSAFGLQG